MTIWYRVPCQQPQGGGKSAPAAPDYTGAANAQSAASKDIATQTTWANRPTVNTPWGQSSWGATAGTDPATGLPVTQWEQNIKLDPDEQAALDAQQRIQQGRSGAAETLLGQATGNLQKEFNWAGMPKAPGSLDEAQQGAFQKMAAMQQPGRMQAEAGLDTKLANMGLPRNSEAWNRAKQQLQSQWNTQDQSMMAQALGEGRADVGAQSAIRQQAIAEEAQRRGMTLNELNALLTGQQVSMPQGMQQAPNSQANAWQAPNLLGAAQAQGNYNLGAQQNNQSGGVNWGSALGGVASAASMFSDRRLKRNIKRIGQHPCGVGIYSYEIFGKPEVGVMAQELIKVKPELVSRHPSGYLMVNYSGL